MVINYIDYAFLTKVIPLAVGLREARTSRQLKLWEHFSLLTLNLAMLHAERLTAALAWCRLASLLHNINFNLINLHVEYLKHIRLGFC